MSTPRRSSARANGAMPVLSETEISARVIFTEQVKEVTKLQS
jgi:hypothetical protein